MLAVRDWFSYTVGGLDFIFHRVGRHLLLRIANRIKKLMGLEPHQLEIVPWLICPQTRVKNMAEVPLTYSDGKLCSDRCSYPVTNGVPNLRLPFDQDSFTSYDDILDDFSTNGPDRERILSVLGLSQENISNAKVLLTGGERARY